MINRSFLILWIGISFFLFSCNFQKIGNNLGSGLQRGVGNIKLDTTNLEFIVRNAINDAIDQAFNADLNEKIRKELNPILAQVQDSVGVISNEFIQSMIGDYTTKWLDTRMEMVNLQLTTTATNVRNQILGQESKELAKSFFQEAVIQQLDGVLKNILKDLSSEANNLELIAVRKLISVQLDSLIASGFKTASTNFDQSFTPILNRYFKEAGLIIDKGDDLGTNTKKNARAIIWQAVGGIAGLLLLSGFGWLFLWTRRYKNIIKIITKNIDGIPDQSVYDRLVGNIRKTMDLNGLNKHLKKILEEQDLDEQPEWDDKDKQVLRLLSEQFINIDSATLSKDQLTQRLYDSAKQVGLENHLKSVLQRMGT